MLQFALCDENEQQLQDTVSVIIDLLPPGIVEITGFSSPSQLLDRIDQDGFQPDLALLHIALSEMSSSALAEQLNRRLPDCRIVFVCTRQNEPMGIPASSGFPFRTIVWGVCGLFWGNPFPGFCRGRPEACFSALRAGRWLFRLTKCCIWSGKTAKRGSSASRQAI